MANILSYLNWRGDLCFSDSHPFNELDNLALAQLAYTNFQGIVPSLETEQSITIAQAAKAYLALHDRPLKNTFDDILFHLAETPRFREARLSNFQEIFDNGKEQTQFAALHIALADNSVYIAFRGTDFTIVGWREDFMMSYRLIPAQRYAAEYLQKTMRLDGRTYRIGGHSKGGNLSVYAAMMCDDAQKEAIAAVYSNDGPGLPPELMCAEAYAKIEHKITHIVPEFSIIGMIFEKGEPQKIVRSSAVGILQHDLLTWEVTANHIKQSNVLSPKCRMFNEILDHWLEDVNLSQREIFVRNFFDALEAGGAKTMGELAAGGIHSFESVLLAMGKSDVHAKRAFWKLVKSIFHALRQIDYGKLLKEKRNVQTMCILLLGVFFVTLPEFALQSFGIAFFLVLLFYCSFRLFRFFCQWRRGEPVEKAKTIFYGAVTGIELTCVLYNKIVVLSAHWVLFFALGWYAYQQIRYSISVKSKGKPEWIVWLLDALLAGVLGITALIFGAEVSGPHLFVAGCFLIVHGILYGCDLLYKTAINSLR